MKIKLPAKVATKFDRSLRHLRRISPELELAAGAVLGIGCVVAACVATLKEEEIIDDVKQNIDDIHSAHDNGVIDDKEQAKKLTVAYAKAAGKTAINYAPAIGLGLASGVCTWKGYSTLKKTAVTATAMYGAEHKKFEEYRARLVDKFDEKLDAELYNGIKTKTVEEEVTDEKGKTKKVTKEVSYMDSIEGSPYSYLFDDYNDEWRGTNERSLTFLLDIEQWANNMLKTRIDYTRHKPGYIFLNEVLEACGFRGNEMGTMAGWLYDPEGWLEGKYDPNEFSCNHKVSFGIFDKYGNECHNCAKFLAGDENAIWLNFRVHGAISDKI